MSVKNIIETKLQSLDMTIGCYDPKLEELTKPNLKKLLDNLEYGSTDVTISIKRRKHVVEVYHVDNEADFNVMTFAEYRNTYGREVGEA